MSQLEPLLVGRSTRDSFSLSVTKGYYLKATYGRVLQHTWESHLWWETVRLHAVRAPGEVEAANWRARAIQTFSNDARTVWFCSASIKSLRIKPATSKQLPA